MFDDDLSSLLLPMDEGADNDAEFMNPNDANALTRTRAIVEEDPYAFANYPTRQVPPRGAPQINQGHVYYPESYPQPQATVSPNHYYQHLPPPPPISQSLPIPALRPPDSTSTSVTKKTKGKKKLTTETKAKRRAAVAAASRATRAKRKRELEELKTKNKRLEKERRDYLGTISELQLKVQALRETGSIDLRMENDLLKAELVEHKRFLGHFRSIAQGLPTTDTTKRVMLLQSADSAVAKVLAVMSTSVVDPSWRYGGFKGRHDNFQQVGVRFQRIPSDTTAVNAKRISLRFDILSSGQSGESLAELVWAKWTREGKGRYYSNFYRVEVNREIRASDIELGEEFKITKGFRTTKPSPAVKEEIKQELVSMSSLVTADTTTSETRERGRLKVFAYSEKLSVPSGSTALSLLTDSSARVEKLMVVTGRECEVSLSSFLKPQNFAHIQSNFRNKPIEVKTCATGRIKAIVLARTFPDPKLEKETVFGGNKSSTEKKYESTIVEGIVFRDDGADCSVTLTYSLPIETKQSKIISPEKCNFIVDEDGYLSKEWEDKLINEFGDLFASTQSHNDDNYLSGLDLEF